MKKKFTLFPLLLIIFFTQQHLCSQPPGTTLNTESVKQKIQTAMLEKKEQESKGVVNSLTQSVQRITHSLRNLYSIVQRQTACINTNTKTMRNIGFKTNDNIYIGSQEANSEKATIRIGDSTVQNSCYIAGIDKQTPTGGEATVYIDSNGKLTSSTGSPSSRRYKKKIKSIEENTNLVEKLQQLKPVSFIYKKDKKQKQHYGLIAEEVAKLFPELVEYNKKGKPDSVHYEQLGSILLAAYQQLNGEHTKLKEIAIRQQIESELIKQQVKTLEQEKNSLLDETLSLFSRLEKVEKLTKVLNKLDDKTIMMLDLMTAHIEKQKQ